VIFSLEINHHQHIGDQDGNECRQRRAGHAQLRQPRNSENQQRREYYIKYDAEDLKCDRRLDDSRRPQR
jgi:hypothetical protein